MFRKFCLVFFLFLPFFSLAENSGTGKDTANIYNKLDTTYITNYRDWLNVKLVFGARTNTFMMTNKLTKESIEYSINSKVNFGIGINFKFIGLEVQFSPKAFNQNDQLYGKSTQFSLAANGNTRRFIYEIFYRYNEGYHTTRTYIFPPDSVESYYKRPDIINNNLGANILYVFNNKKFSSAAPYNLTQKQRKSAGSFLLGAYAFSYSIEGDTIIHPDTLYSGYKPEMQFRSAASYTLGLSCGYTYTIIFFKHWFFNIATIPGFSMQQFTSVNAFDKSVFTKNTGSLSLQSKFSLGYNRKQFFMGMSWVNNNFLINSDEASTMNYKYGTFRFYYGHRFDLRKMLKKKL